MYAGYLLGNRGKRNIDAILISEAAIDDINGVGDAIPLANKPSARPEAWGDLGGIGASGLL